MRTLSFSSDIFFLLLLPPVIFNSGYHARRRFFLTNIGAILGLAIVGTLVRFAVLRTLHTGTQLHWH
jgi:NhaP-type Na+/H+ or K+/H+ antiporter